MGDTPERERSVPMENVEEVKKKSKRKFLPFSSVQAGML